MTDQDQQQQRQVETTVEGQQAAAAAPGGEVVARPDRKYRRKFLLMFIGSLLVGAWFGYDGFVGWPEQNRKLAEANRSLAEAQERKDSAGVAKWSEEQKKYTNHSDRDIALQKLFCAAAPLLGLAIYLRVRHASRGQLRLDGKTLYFPGHPPVELDSIRRIDKKLWERKGIAYLDYEQGGAKGRLKVDDFAYEQGATDEIFKRVEAYLLPPVEGGGGAV